MIRDKRFCDQRHYFSGTARMVRAKEYIVNRIVMAQGQYIIRIVCVIRGQTIGNCGRISGVWDMMGYNFTLGQFLISDFGHKK